MSDRGHAPPARPWPWRTRHGPACPCDEPAPRQHPFLDQGGIYLATRIAVPRRAASGRDVPCCRTASPFPAAISRALRPRPLGRRSLRHNGGTTALPGPRRPRPARSPGPPPSWPTVTGKGAAQCWSSTRGISAKARAPGALYERARVRTLDGIYEPGRARLGPPWPGSAAPGALRARSYRTRTPCTRGSVRKPPHLQPPRLQACRQLLGPAASRIAVRARTRDLALRGTASLASPKLRAFGTAERRSRPGRRTPSMPRRAGGPADAQTARTGPARFGPARPTTITLCSET